MTAGPRIPVSPLSAAEKTVLIVGGGLAGLACAIRLQEAGVRTTIFERSYDVGGSGPIQWRGFCWTAGSRCFWTPIPKRDTC
ncbi:MAG: FAD-dependent oxidoreductase [Acidobacteria bacterium]|nr:FAD-dependent oxidoreductase [Acidobacteriota bacterium]